MIFSDPDRDHYIFDFKDFDRSSTEMKVGQDVSFINKPGKNFKHTSCGGPHGPGGGLIGDSCSGPHGSGGGLIGDIKQACCIRSRGSRGGVKGNSDR